MANLQTSFMNININSPIIVGACNLLDNVDEAIKIEENGAGAVVYKTLFEEQVELENLQLKEIAEEYSERHAEMVSIFPTFKHFGPEAHLKKLKDLKKILKIPVIASLNCVTSETWVDYSKKIEQTGVDGIELNFYSVPSKSDKEFNKIEYNQLKTLEALRNSVKIPLSVKLSYFYTNILGIIKKMDDIGVKGFVLFHRLFQPDIDIKNLNYFYPAQVSCEHENRIPLRWTGIVYGNINSDICSNTGIYSSKDIIKMLLSGASCIQTVSALYKNSSDYIKTLLDELNLWMDDHKFNQISDIKGKLAKINIKDPFFYERSQYIDILTKNETIIKKEFAR